MSTNMDSLSAATRFTWRRTGGAASRYTVCVNYRSDAAAAAAVVEHIRAGGGHAVAMQADIGHEQQVGACALTTPSLGL